METYPIRLGPGEDLKAALDALVAEKGWNAACVLTGIGSLRQVAIRFANVPQAEIRPGPWEIISLGGTLSPNGSHLHLLVADGQGTALGGHLKEGSPVHTTAEIVVGILEDWEFSREVDSATGFPELSVRKAAVPVDSSERHRLAKEDSKKIDHESANRD